MQANGSSTNISPSVRHTIQNHGSDYYLAASPTNLTLIAASTPDNYARWQLSSSTNNNNIYTIRLQPTDTCLHATVATNTLLALHSCSPSDNIWNLTQTAQRDGYTIQISGGNGYGLRVDGRGVVGLAEVSDSPDFVWSLSDVGNVGSLPPIVVPTTGSSSGMSSSTASRIMTTTVANGATTSTKSVSVTQAGTSSTSVSMAASGGQSFGTSSAATSPSVTPAPGSGAAEHLRGTGWKLLSGIVALTVLLISW